MLLGLLLPDPGHQECPERFRREARAVLGAIRPIGSSDEELREALLWFIGFIASWERSTKRLELDVARRLVRAAYPEEAPIVLDPFSGGGSIPLEALRLGCDAFASDLNPVAAFIGKVLLEDIPRQGSKLSEEVRKAGREIEQSLQAELATLYPTYEDGSEPIAYLWARTVRCEEPKCGAEIPLLRTLWLSKRAKRKRALRCKVVRRASASPRVEFDVFEPQADGEVGAGTIRQARATCVACNGVVAADRVRAQLVEQRGGTNVALGEKGERIGGAQLVAIVAVRRDQAGRIYRVASAEDYKAVARASELLDATLHKDSEGLASIPNEPLPPVGTLGFRVQRYGMTTWADLFSTRQLVSLHSLLARVGTCSPELATREALACAFSRVAMSAMSCTRWNPTAEKMQHTFGRQALPIVWDFAEVVPTANAPGNWASGYRLVADVIDAWPGSDVGQAHQADAASHPLPDHSASVWFTDPPYYDAVPYSDLSDFFFVWLKRALPNHPLLRDARSASNFLTPKAQEIVQDRSKTVDGRVKDGAFFEKSMERAFSEGRRVLADDGVGCVVFAHKTTEGWEALLSGLTRGGWTITASWPIATEMGSRLRARDSAALATSVHLVCRPRAEEARVGDWGEVLRELPGRVGDWMEALQGEGVRGADLVFACIGPALEIFSRHSKVETAEGRAVELGEYLEKVWEVVGREALAQVLGTAEARARNGAAGAVEEDARLTALFLWTLQSTDGDAAEGASEEDAGGDPSDGEEDEEESASRGKAKGFTLVFDVVRRFAQPLGIELPKWEGRVVETKKGVVRLLPIAERAKQLFGEEGAQAVAARLEEQAALGPLSLQGLLFPELEAAPKVRGRGARGRGGRARAEISDESLAAAREATTLDRVHAAMLLQAGGRANALRALVKAEQERGPDFLRLANALSALYPRGSEEKRLLDAMLLAVPR